MTNQTVTITCPNCNEYQRATIDTYAVPGTGMVIDAFVHVCTECGYIIGESEWNQVLP